jgi:hypothetical protein
LNRQGLQLTRDRTWRPLTRSNHSIRGHE